MTGDQQNQQQEYTKQSGGGFGGGGNPFEDMFGGGRGAKGRGENQGNYYFLILNLKFISKIRVRRRPRILGRFRTNVYRWSRWW